MQVDYHLDAGSYNEVPAGVPYPLLIDPGYQPGATDVAGNRLTQQIDQAWRIGTP